MRSLVIAVILSVAVSLNAQIKAITQDGDVVILYSNGTWVFEDADNEAIAPKTEETSTPFNDYAESDYDIRTSNWGDSNRQVKAIENIPANEWIEEKQVGYDIDGFKTTVAGLEAVFVYYFVDDILVGARYIIVENHSNNDDYVKDYNRLNDILSEKYGNNRIEEEWHDERWKDNPSEKGYALWQGDVTMNCKWETKSTEISHRISARDFEIVHIIDYESKEYGDLFDKGVNKSGKDVL
jgi:hypothetical protein